MLDNLQDFLGVFLSLLSSSAAPLLCPRYRPSYPTRGCANYIGGRESASRPTIEIACRLSAWPPQPFPPSLSFSSRYILFPPRAFPPATTNNTSTRRRPRRNDNKVVGSAIVPAWRSGHRAFLVSEVARRLLYDRRTSTTTATTTPTTTKTTTAAAASSAEDVILREFVFLPGPHSPYGILSFLVFLLYLRFLALHATWLCTQMCARKSANMMDRAHVDELLSGMNAFLFTISFYDALRHYFLSLFLSRFISIRTSSFFLPLYLDLCWPQRDRKIRVSREKRFFFSQRFLLDKIQDTRLSYRPCVLALLTLRDDEKYIEYYFSHIARRCAQFYIEP